MSRVKHDAIYTGEREVKTYVDLHHAANVLLKEFAEKEPKGSTWTSMVSIVMRAFTFEAYLNHLGEGEDLALWTAGDRKLSWKDKLKKLRKQLGLGAIPKGRPYETLNELFKYRNQLAHGRTVRLKGSVKANSKDFTTQRLPTLWESYSTVENARRAGSDMDKVIVELNVAAGLGDYPWIGGFGVGSLEPIPARGAKRKGTRP